MDEPKKKMQYGVTNCGFSYEEVVSAFFALKLLKNSEIKNFRFELNACAYKKFDDLIIEVEYQDLFKEKFAIQLKHREPGRDLLRIEDLEKGNKKFLISDYLKRYKELDEDIKNGYKFILFTNTKFANLDNSKCYKVEKVCSPFRTEIFTTNEVYKFEEKTPSGEEFYNNFFLISGQKNFKEMRENIVEMLQKEFFVSEKTACSYILFFEDLQKKLYENTEITRNTVILKLIDLFLGENIMKVDLVGPKMELFGSVLRAFDVTCLPKIDERCNCGTIDIDNEIRNLANVNKMVLSEEKLQERKCQILAIFKKRCLFVRLKEKNEKTICEIVKLCQSLVNYRITFVLDGKIKREGKFFSIKIFHNLALLKNLDFDLYQMIIKKFKIGLQGRNAETLETLQINFGLPLDEFVGPYELFQGFTTGLVVGKKTEILPKPFIKRCLTRTSSFNLGKDQITIHCDDKIKVLNTFIKENNIQAEIVTGECNNCFNHVRLVDNSLEWVVTKIDPDSPELFENQLNVICGNPGIGKTTMMKYLVKKCPLNFWIVTVPLKQLNYFLKNKYSCEKFLEKFVNAEEGFVSKIIEFSKTSKNLIFFFDGLDELNEECVDGTIRKINILLEEGYKCWISCTKRLKTTLKQNFGVCSMYDIEEISEENQKTYISEKLKYQKKSSEFIEKAMAKILQTNFVNICKLPLTLYILTEILSKAEDIDDFENYLSLTQIYENFIEGRLKHNLEKAGYDTSTNSLRNIIETFKNCYFIQYRIGALKACLEPQHYKKLKLKNDKFFLKQVEESGDFIGVITEVISDNIVFGHFKIAQYFAALWISENFQKIPLFRRTFLFEPKYLQIRYFLNVKLAEKCPLHLAILNRDFPKVKELAKKHLNDLDEAGRTALHYASFIGTKHSFSDEIPQQLGFEDGIDRKILSFLLELDVDILKKDKLYRWNCFHYADASLSLSLLEELSKKEELELKYLKNYKDLQKLIELCVKYGYVNLLQSVTKLKNLKELDTGESSFLHLALENGKEEIAEFLIESGANLDKVNKKGQTVLHVATFWNCSKIVKKLKIDVNLKDNEYKTALHYAAKKGNLEILKFLIENGALLDPTDVRKRTPLHKAAYMGKTEVVKTLIQKGCDVNFCDNDDKTPLQRACDMDHLDTVKILVENSADMLWIGGDGLLCIGRRRRGISI